MNQAELIKSVTSTYEKGVKLIQRKNSDYAKPDIDAFANFRGAEIIGISVEKAILVRVLDKISRINTVIDNEFKNNVSDETVEDTLIDAVNYLAILKAYLENKKSNKKPMK